MNVFEAMQYSIKTGAKIRIAEWSGDEYIFWDNVRKNWRDEANKKIPDGLMGSFISLLENREGIWEVFTEPSYVWINVYRENSLLLSGGEAHRTLEHANRRGGDGRVGCIRVELREEFDEEVQP